MGSIELHARIPQLCSGLQLSLCSCVTAALDGAKVCKVSMEVLVCACMCHSWYMQTVSVQSGVANWIEH